MFCLFSRSFNARTLGVLSAALGLALLSGAPAQAALIQTGSCDDSTLTQPFAAWGDTGLYKLAPGGSFDDGLTGWALTGGAHTVAGGEPFGVTGTSDTSSLYLPAGASAQTAFTCVNASYPTLRFFGRNVGLLSTVLVQVVYKLPLLGQVAVPVGVVTLSPNWEPTLPMITASAVTGLLSGGTTSVAIRFTALTGASQVDDVFIDPRMRY